MKQGIKKKISLSEINFNDVFFVLQQQLSIIIIAYSYYVDATQQYPMKFIQVRHVATMGHRYYDNFGIEKTSPFGGFEVWTDPPHGLSVPLNAGLHVVLSIR